MRPKIKKSLLIVLAGLLVVGMTTAVQADDLDKYKSSHQYYYSGSRHQDYPSPYRDYRGRNYPGESRYYDQHYRSERQVVKEIRRNEKRIRKLEKQVRNLYRKRYSHRGYYRYNDYNYRIRQLEWEISRLQKRNHQLRSLLYHRNRY